MLENDEDWLSAEHDCIHCGWSGCGIALVEQVITSDFIEMRCPACEQCVAFALAPGVQQAFPLSSIRTK
jgi:hypothetical protein